MDAASPRHLVGCGAFGKGLLFPEFIIGLADRQI
jgi:hypothetical protein